MQQRPTMPTGVYVSPALSGVDIVVDMDGALWIVNQQGWQHKRPYLGHTTLLRFAPPWWSQYYIADLPADIIAAHRAAYDTHKETLA